MADRLCQLDGKQKSGHHPLTHPLTHRNQNDSIKNEANLFFATPIFASLALYGKNFNRNHIFMKRTHDTETGSTEY